MKISTSIAIMLTTFTLLAIQAEAREVIMKAQFDGKPIGKNGEVTIIITGKEDRDFRRRLEDSEEVGQFRFALVDEGFIEKDKIRVNTVCYRRWSPLKGNLATSEGNGYYIAKYGSAGHIFTIGQDGYASEPIILEKDTDWSCTK